MSSRLPCALLALPFLILPLLACDAESRLSELEDRVRTAADELAAAGERSASSGREMDPEGFELSLDRVRRFVEANENLQRLDATWEPRVHAGGLAAPAAVERAVASAGLTIEEYVMINLTLLPAWLAAEMRAAGMGEGVLPPGVGDGVADQHLRFVEDNRDEIEALMERLDGMG